jgi:hypothetical protein
MKTEEHGLEAGLTEGNEDNGDRRKIGKEAKE